MTLAAQVFTAPVLLLSFHQLSFVSLFSNLLAVPLLPFVMVSGMLFLAAPVASGLASLPLLGFLFLLQQIVALGALIPFGFVSVQNGLFALAFLPAVLVLLWKRREFQEERQLR